MNAECIVASQALIRIEIQLCVSDVAAEYEKASALFKNLNIL